MYIYIFNQHTDCTPNVTVIVLQAASASPCQTHLLIFSHKACCSTRLENSNFGWLDSLFNFTILSIFIPYLYTKRVLSYYSHKTCLSLCSTVCPFCNCYLFLKTFQNPLSAFNLVPVSHLYLNLANSTVVEIVYLMIHFHLLKDCGF